MQTKTEKVDKITRKVDTYPKLVVNCAKKTQP